MEQKGILTRKRLPVLNRAPVSESAGYVLDAEGRDASVERVDPAVLRERAIAVLREIFDPEIPVNIYELGLIYELRSSETGDLVVRMTLTSPACPVAGVLVSQVHERLRELAGVARVRTELVWDPPWTKARMSEAARLALDMF